MDDISTIFLPTQEKKKEKEKTLIKHIRESIRFIFSESGTINFLLAYAAETDFGSHPFF